jgi:ATP-dependent exoDNAse (exonuclease V) beta subunit
VRLALEHGGEQVLANVLHVAELARQYEADGGISFRGFIEELRGQAEDGQAGEAPILEEGSDGVRMMTVHKAKGLEFPVVILADITAKLQPSAASRYLDPVSGTCAIRLAGCSPHDLLHHEQDELRRDQAEGVRLAYVAATRARDLLVVPAVGDQEREGWIEPLNRAIYPPVLQRRDAVPAPGCPAFASKDSVLLRPSGDPALPVTVAPGQHHLGTNYSVVWWDPRNLDLGAEPPLGIRRSELIVKDVPDELVAEGLGLYQTWRRSRDAAVESAASPSIATQTVTAWAAAKLEEAAAGISIALVELPRQEGRPTGIRFGALVHAALATAPLAADEAAVRSVVNAHARTLSSTDEEIASAAHVVQRVLGHSLLDRARRADVGRLCRREVPVTWRESSGTLVEGVLDLAFKERGTWIVVDFKTDEELRREANYFAQLAMYVRALQAATGDAASGILLRL